VAALLVGVFSRGRGHWFVFLIAAVGMILSLSAMPNSPDAGIGSLPGIKLGPMAAYARLITLAFGVLLLLICWHLPEATDRGEFFGMVLFSMVGVMLTGLADDLIVLLIALELVSMPTYVLVAAGRTDPRAQEAGIKYFFLGAMATALTAYGFSFLYGLAGTTVISIGQTTITTAADGHGDEFLFVAGLALAIFGLAFKVAAVPMHFYAADVYEGAAAPVTGLLGFVPKLAGFIALAKVLSTTGGHLPDVIFWLLWGLAAGTMIVGNVLALMQTNVKRILAYSSIAHSGYMLVALLVGPVAQPDAPIRDGIGAMMFYIAIYGAMNLGAFAVIGLLRTRAGFLAEGERLDDLAGLSRAYPGAALAMAVCVFGLMGMPPTAGFVGKVYIFGSALSLEPGSPDKVSMIVLAVMGLLMAAVGAVYYLRIVAACYLREPVPGSELRTVPCGLLKLGVGLAALIVILAGLLPSRLIADARRASRDVTPTKAAAPAPTAQAPAEDRVAHRPSGGASL
jgi:NADH-quinone oxidoreductase subunit N